MSRIATALVLALISIGCASSGAGAQGDAGAPPPNDANSQWSGQPYTESVPGTTVGLEMVPIPGGTVEVETPRGTQRVEIAPFYMSRVEVPWDVFDVWVFALDEGTQVATGKGEEAVSRPSRPYVLPGRNWGHDGMPALAMTPHAATVFANWLSEKTGHTYRLPTQAEWIYACRANQEEPADLEAVAWYFQNANDRTHPGGSKEANAFGLADMLGNVGEWAIGADGEPILMGGSYDDTADQVRCDAGKKQTPAWNATDPQLPKSEWWLADAPFVGLRLVREP
ncbi:MAG TPA: formylglycine-generating enzyme family protein [Longimicrobiaceae bacterium]